MGGDQSCDCAANNGREESWYQKGESRFSEGAEGCWSKARSQDESGANSRTGHSVGWRSVTVSHTVIPRARAESVYSDATGDATALDSGRETKQGMLRR